MRHALLATSVAAAAILYLPWLLDFSSQAGGLQPYVGAGTRPAHLLLQFGPLLAAGGAIGAETVNATTDMTAMRPTGEKIRSDIDSTLVRATNNLPSN